MAHEKVVVHVDGGARGNPGPAAVAAVATGPDGELLGERSEYVGEATNNVAEYRAVQLGIALARDLGAAEVEVVNDSQLVARQIGGEYRVKSKDLMPLFTETMAALRGFERWTVRDVRREQNERADQLVNEELDRRAGGSRAKKGGKELPAQAVYALNLFDLAPNDDYREYSRRSAEAVAKHGGKVIALGRFAGEVESEGAEPRGVMILVGWPSQEAFDAFRDDPQLADLHELRVGGTNGYLWWLYEKLNDLRPLFD